jgi:hypothetical protein
MFVRVMYSGEVTVSFDYVTLVGSWGNCKCVVMAHGCIGLYHFISLVVLRVCLYFIFRLQLACDQLNLFELS